MPVLRAVETGGGRVLELSLVPVRRPEMQQHVLSRAQRHARELGVPRHVTRLGGDRPRAEQVSDVLPQASPRGRGVAAADGVDDALDAAHLPGVLDAEDHPRQDRGGQRGGEVRIDVALAAAEQRRHGLRSGVPDRRGERLEAGTRQVRVQQQAELAVPRRIAVERRHQHGLPVRQRLAAGGRERRVVAEHGRDVLIPGHQVEAAVGRAVGDRAGTAAMFEHVVDDRRQRRIVDVEGLQPGLRSLGGQGAVAAALRLTHRRLLRSRLIRVSLPAALIGPRPDNERHNAAGGPWCP